MNAETLKRLQLVAQWFLDAPEDARLKPEQARQLGHDIIEAIASLTPTARGEWVDPLGPGISQGLLILAADTLRDVHEGLANNANPVLILEKLTEAIVTVIHELEAQAEDVAWLVSQRSNPTTDPEQIGAILKRTLRRRRARK